MIEVSFQIFFTPVIEKLINSKIDLTAYDSIRGNFPNYLLMLLVGWVVGGLIEEILFRGFLITRLSRLFKNINIGHWFAIVLTSLTFGFSHLYQGWSGVISTSLIALLFGLIFIVEQNIMVYNINTRVHKYDSLTLSRTSRNQKGKILTFLHGTTHSKI